MYVYYFKIKKMSRELGKIQKFKWSCILFGSVEGFFLPNPKVRVGWIGNSTQKILQSNLYFRVGLSGC